MAQRNVPITPGSGDNVSFDDNVQRVKLTTGATGTQTDVSLADPIPSSDATAQAKLDAIVSALSGILNTAPTGSAQSWAPGYGRADLGGGPINVDQSGALVSRSLVLTDEGTARVNFANTSLSVSIGSVTISGAVVTGTFPDTLDLTWGSYFKLDADAESAWVQIYSKDSETQITLVSDYVGGSSGAASRAQVRPVTGSGGAIAVASGTSTLTLGTTAVARTGIERRVDYGPLIFRARVTMSQRIANQDILVGLREVSLTPRWFARFRANGTTNTALVCETGRNPTGAPSANETQSTTIVIPNGLTTATARDMRVELLTESTRFFIDSILVAEHINVIPLAHDTMTMAVEGINGTTPATSTVVTVDYLTCKNHDKLEVGIFSDTEKIVANTPPAQSFSYSVAGVIAINTDLLVIDCLQFRSLSIQCASMGTTGVVTVAWCNEPTFTIPVTASLDDQAGATSTTISAAGLRVVNVMARYCRIRLTTATTAGTTTFNVQAFQVSLTAPKTTQPVSGSVTATGIAGPAAHDAAISGNPVRMAGRALTASYTTVATGDTADLVTTLQGALVQKPYSIPELEWYTPAQPSGIVSSTTPVVLRAAPGAALRHYITQIDLSTETLGTATEFCIRDTAVSANSQTIASNTLTISAAHGWTIGDAVVASASTVTGLTAGTQYYVLTVPSTTTATFSAAPGGSTLAISGTGVTATLNRIIYRTKLNTTALPGRQIDAVNPLKGGINQSVEMVTLTSSTGGVFANVNGYTAAG